MNFPTFSRALLLLAAWPIALQAGSGLPANLGGGLDKLVAWHLAHAPQPPSAQRRALLDADQPSAKHTQVDDTASSAIVDVRLDGTRTVAEVQTALEALGCTVLGVTDIGHAGSIISVKLPLDYALAAARTPGVRSLVLAQKPRRHVGKVTSQGVHVMKADGLTKNNTPLTGSGLTVGVISDSYDMAYTSDPTIGRASADVLSDDLPGTGNPAGHTLPVVVLEDGAPSQDDPPEDEGRAMLQIVHDVAPGAKLVFNTSGVTQTTFANAIRALRTTGLADVIVDDISFADEPAFSDGPVALAVDDVVNSTTLAGRRVAYYSAAGNDGALGYNDTFRPVNDVEVRARRPKNNLQLTSVPKELTAGGFHNFGTPDAPVITQKIKVQDDIAELDLQWDDPFMPVGNEPAWVTTDYNLLVFSSTGVFLGGLSGVDDNIATGQPFEYADLPLGSYGRARSFQIAITRSASGTQQATHFRYVASTGGRFESVPFQRLAPTIVGHAAARGSDGVAAYHYDDVTAPADFTSLGPVTIYFDRTGHRLANAEVRNEPTIAAPDNVDTTFFPPGPYADTDKTNFPNFSGTSAAAPHAAGVAALLLQAKGGPGSLTSAQLRTALQGSVSSHDIDYAHSQAVITSAGATVTLEARGDTADDSSADPRFFKLSFNAPANTRLTQVVIDLSTATAALPLVFDPSAVLGYPFHVGAFSGIAKRDFVGVVGPNPRKLLTLKLRYNTFAGGATLEFGIDRDQVQLDEKGKPYHAGGNSADLLEGATVKVTTLNLDTNVSTESSGVFVNAKGKGYSPVDGFGLINAQAALGLLPP